MDINICSLYGILRIPKRLCFCAHIISPLILILRVCRQHKTELITNTACCTSKLIKRELTLQINRGGGNCIEQRNDLSTQ